MKLFVRNGRVSAIFRHFNGDVQKKRRDGLPFRRKFREDISFILYQGSENVLTLV